MELGLSGKTALVVGASRGLGRAVALGLAREGAHVIAVARTASDLASLAAELSNGKRCDTIAMDLAEEGAPARLAARVGREAVDILIQNLGGNLDIRDPLCSGDELRQVLDFNLIIAAEINRLLIPPMRARGWGRVLHVSSNAAVARRGSLAYGVAKAALNAYTENLGRAVAADGVVISAVMPGAMAYPGSHWDRRMAAQPAEVERYLHERVAAGKFASPEEVASFIIYLCSDLASQFVGSVVQMDGGGM